MRVITISGLDGSGKSTQVDRLRDRFEAEGKSVRYFHAVHFSVAQAHRRLRRRAGGSSEASERAAVTTASAAAIALRKVVLRIDLSRYRGLLRRLARAGVDVLVSDRFYYDNLVNIAFLEHSDSFVNVTPTRPDVAIYLHAEPEAIMARDRAPEQGIGYLVAKRALYDALATRFALTVIDGSGTPDAVEKAITAELG
jgi:dTMP kinase